MRAMAAAGFQVDLRDLLDSLPVMIAVIDREHRYVFVNRPYETLHQCKRDEIQGRHLAEKLGDANYADIRPNVERALAGERVQFDVSFPDPLGDGEQTFSTKYIPKLDANGAVIGFYSLASNITPRKRAEREREQLREKVLTLQKLESLASLAGGVAHDFNNLLVAVLGNAELARTALPEDHGVREELAQIEIAARRASELSRQMLAYSGKGGFRAEALDLSGVAMEMAGLLRASLRPGVTLTIEADADLPGVTADPIQIRQVLLNLLTNASEAIDGSGRVVLRTGEVDATREELAATYIDDDLPAGRYVFFEVEDDGVGMDEPTLRRLFDPFFTTKFTGRGLGLAASLGIVRAHRGAIGVESEPGRGARFRVLLPAGADRAPVQVAPPRARSERHGTGHILVVDDEPFVRRTARRMLERGGYTVTTAEHGAEAIEIFWKDPKRFAAVVLDLTMPVMGGAETLQRLRAIASGIPVILCSGYSEEQVREQFGRPGLAAVVEKPFTVDALLAAVQSVLP
jgi:two-component system cell cycle sensor histidine kinase/response regulator CckA